MKEKAAKLISSTVLFIAKKTSNAACNWRTYQPHVPKKLLEKG